jgi:hypothetical protein
MANSRFTTRAADRSSSARVFIVRPHVGIISESPKVRVETDAVRADTLQFIRDSREVVVDTRDMVVYILR